MNKQVESQLAQIGFAKSAFKRAALIDRAMRELSKDALYVAKTDRSTLVAGTKSGDADDVVSLPPDIAQALRIAFEIAAELAAERKRKAERHFEKVVLMEEKYGQYQTQQEDEGNTSSATLTYEGRGKPLPDMDSED